MFQNRVKAVDPMVTSAPDYRGDRPGPGTVEVMQEYKLASFFHKFSLLLLTKHNKNMAV